MKIPMKVDYGVRALVELAQRDPDVDSSMQTAEIARRQQIPEAYLDQVLTILNKAGLIKSRRGPHGGHVLDMDPEDIGLGLVMGVLEGRAPLLDCLVEPDECSLSDTCAQREAWGFFEEAMEQLLNATTIGDMVRRQRQLIANKTLQPISP